MKALVALALLSGAAEQHVVTMPGKYFSPARLTVVVGDEVSWRNTDLENHNVQAVDGSFGSGLLGRFGGFSHTFGSAGARPYVCTLHPFMRGSVDAVAALLHGPAGTVLAGEQVSLEGRATPGAAVALEHRMPDGSWHEVGRTVAAGDGGFAFSAIAEEGSAYRAVTVAGASPVVAPAVTSRIETRIRVRRGRVLVRSDPAQPGLVAALQRYSRERYMWRRIDHARLDRRGRARFRVRTARGGRVRVLLSRRPRGPVLATTAVVRVRDGRVVSDPAVPHGGSGMPAPGHPEPPELGHGH